MLEIIPAILTADPFEAKKLLATFEGEVERVQIDIIDGVFADNKTIKPSDLVGLDPNILIDYHLMVKDPINWISGCAENFADRIIGQIELMENQKEFVAEVTATGLKVGLAVDLNSSIESIDPEILTDVDLILLMSVKAGFGGQKFDDSVFEKIKILNKIKQKDESPFRVCIDGGVTPQVSQKLTSLVEEVSIGGKRLLEGSLHENINRYSHDNKQ